jgi:hypothetical protein
MALEQLHGAGTGTQSGLTFTELRAAHSQFTVAARERAIASLARKGDIVREQSGHRAKPFRISPQGQQRLDNFRRSSVTSNQRETTQGQFDPDEALLRLAHMYARTMFPDDDHGPGRR